MAVLSSEMESEKEEKPKIDLQNENVKPQKQKDVKILLVGTTGSGKSSTGNTVLSAGKDNTEKVVLEFFDTAPASAPQTRFNEELTRTVFDRRVTVVDTPGANNEDDKVGEICEEIESAVRRNEEGEGYHAIVYVVKIFEKSLEMNEEELKTLDQVEKMLGDKFFDYVILLFTFGSNYQQMLTQMKKQNAYKNYPELSFEEVISKDRLSNNRYAIGPFIRKVQNRAVLFDNAEKDAAKREEMVKQLLGKVDEIVKNKEVFTHSLLPERKPPKENQLQVKQRNDDGNKRNACSCWVLAVLVVVFAVLILLMKSASGGRGRTF